MSPITLTSLPPRDRVILDDVRLHADDEGVVDDYVFGPATERLGITRGVLRRGLSSLAEHGVLTVHPGSGRTPTRVVLH